MPAARGLGQVEPGRLDRGDRRPAHAEVALDGAGHRRGRDHLAGEAAVLGVELDDGVHVGGRAADVDDHHVADARALGVEAAGEQLDAGEHDVGGRAADHRGEVGAGAQVLAADHVGQEHLADRGPRRVGREHADPRHHVVGEHVRDARRGSPRPRRGPRRCRRPRPGRSSRRSTRCRAAASSGSALPPSVPPVSSTTSGRVVCLRTSVGRRPQATTRLGDDARPPCRRWTARPGGRPRR